MTDQDTVEKAIILLVETMSLNETNIKSYHWVAACQFLITSSFYQAGVSYETFCDEMIKSLAHYKKFWDDSP